MGSLGPETLWVRELGSKVQNISTPSNPSSYLKYHLIENSIVHYKHRVSYIGSGNVMDIRAIL